METAADRLKTVLTTLESACARANRNSNQVELIAVSKTRDDHAILPVLQAGQKHFGENRVQEAAGKWPALKQAFPDVILHLIGSLQSNKAADSVALFDYIHTLDRLSLAEALSKEMLKQAKPVRCFIQVNIGDEAQKSGVSVAGLADLLTGARNLKVPVVGLMCIPPVNDHPAPHFALLAKLAKHHALPELSMGMSGDADSAVLQGATYVRVGSAIFGART